MIRKEEFKITRMLCLGEFGRCGTIYQEEQKRNGFGKEDAMFHFGHVYLRCHETWK